MRNLIEGDTILSMNKKEVYKLLQRYESPSALELKQALDAVKQLVEAGEMSETLAKNIMKLLISKHIHDELTGSVRVELLGGRRNAPKTINFMGFKYGRRHETYA